MWFSNFLTQRYIATKYGNSTSKFKQTHKGLPQGAVSSTTLLNITINDLPAILSESGINLKTALVDDLDTWLSASRNKKGTLTQGMNKALLDLQEWCQENYMMINTDKTFNNIFSLCHTAPDVKVAIK